MSLTLTLVPLPLWGRLKMCSQVCPGQRPGVGLERQEGDQEGFIQLMLFMMLQKVLKRLKRCSKNGWRSLK